jgi:hypothetical protein
MIKAEEEKVALFKRVGHLKRANADSIVGFFKTVEAKFFKEINNYEKLKRVPKIRDTIKQLEKHIGDTFMLYEKDILELQDEKERKIKLHSKQIDCGLEKFADQSKDLIKNFKHQFKKFTAIVQSALKSDDVENITSLLRNLKDKLYEIEVYLKGKIKAEVELFISEITTTNNAMGDRTNLLKDQLSYKKNFQEITTYVEVVTNPETVNTLQEEDIVSQSLIEEVKINLILVKRRL